MFYRRGDQLLFHVQISDGGGKRLVGAISDVVAPVSDPLRGIEELRNRLMGWLELRYDERLQIPASAAIKPPTYESYRAFSDGMSLYIATQNARAIPLFLQAYELDSSFVQALLYGSMALTNVGDWARADSVLAIADARRVALSDFDRDWLDFRLGIVRGDGERTLRGIRSAAERAPDSKATYNHAVTAFQNGYMHEAAATIKKLRPDRGSMRGFAAYWGIYGSIEHALGDFASEFSVGREGHDMYPTRMMTLPSMLRAEAATGDLSGLASVLREARRLSSDPYHWDYGWLLAEAASELRAHGHPDDARYYWTELAEWLTARDSSEATRWRMVQAYYELGRLELAATALTTLRRKDSLNVDFQGMAGLIAARDGRRGSAMAIAESLSNSTKPYTFGLPDQYRARIAALLGNKEEAVVALNQALSKGTPFHLWIHRDPDLQFLRGYGPYEKLLRGRD